MRPGKKSNNSTTLGKPSDRSARIMALVNSKQAINRRDEKYYLISILGMDKDIVAAIFARIDNKNPNVIID